MKRALKGSLWMARRSASRATSSETPDISNSTRPGLMFATQNSGEPLPEPMRYALVWCERPERADAIAALGEADFLAQLQAAFGHRAGRFLRATPAHAYALGLVRQRDEARRLVRIGNAAQALHPVTGQGLNLGLRDAYGLAQAIARHGATPEAITHMRAERRADRWATVRITDSLARGFALPWPPLRHAAGLGLLALDLAAPLRGAIARQMMFGIRD